MKIVIATFGYLPYSFGGTENYVYDQVKEFKKNNQHVTIISTLDKLPKDLNSFYEDEYIIAFKYLYEDVNVIALYLNVTNTSQLYDLDNNYLLTSYKSIFKIINLIEVDVLQFNCFTSLINLNLYNAVKEFNNNLRFIFCVHTSYFCMKGTLINSTSRELCNINVNTKDCFNCFYFDYQNESYFNSLILYLSKTQIARNLLPLNQNKYKLFDQFINSIKNLNDKVNHFVVYSDLYKNILLNLGVSSSKILVNRHGTSLEFKLITPKKVHDKLIFMYSGRLMNAKGVETLINAWELLEESNTRLLYLIFPGYTNSDIPAEVLTHFSQRSDVVIIQSPTKIDLINYYQEAHCVIIPSESIEIGPLVFHEALSASCNLIISNNNGCIELAEYYNNNDAIKIFEMKNEIQLKNLIETFTYKDFNLSDKIISIEKHFKNLIDKYTLE